MVNEASLGITRRQNMRGVWYGTVTVNTLARNGAPASTSTTTCINLNICIIHPAATPGDINNVPACTCTVAAARKATD